MTSTTTLIQVANEALRAIGERPIPRLSGPTGDRCKDAIRQALVDLEVAYQWEWLHATVPAVSWNLETATLIDVSSVLDVKVGDTVKGFRVLAWRDKTSFDCNPLQAYQGTTDEARTWTMPTYTEVQVNPYPTDSVSQLRIVFYVVRTLTMPALESDVFQVIPERFIPLLVKKVSSHLAARLLDDQQAQQSFDREFMTLVMAHQRMSRKSSKNQLTMFRRF